MDRVNGTDWVDIGGGRRGFRSQNAAAGIPGTEVTDKILNDVQEEICAVIENSGFVLDPENQQQLWEALQSIAAPGFANRAAWLPVISVTTGAPPNNPTIGDAYIIPAGASGPWAGNQQKLAEWTGASWRIVNTKNGHGVSLPDGRIFERVDGAYIEKVAIDSQSGKWNYAAAAGSANALTVNLAPVLAAYVPGTVIFVKIATTNTGAATLKIGALSALPIVHDDGSVLSAGDLLAGSIATFVCDGNRFIFANAQRGRLIGQKSFTSPGVTTYTATPGTRFVIVEVQGAGGSGGGSLATGANVISIGSGGSSGAYAKALIDSGFDGVPITVGARGTATVGGFGVNGESSSFGTYVSAPGGAGGSRGGPTAAPWNTGQTTSPQPSGGNIVSVGGAGGGVSVALSAAQGFGGVGGSSVFGGGGGATAPGVNGGGAVGYGSGGGGTMNGQNASSALAGGNGGHGCVIVWEFA